VLRALRLPLAGPPVPRLAGRHKNDKARETGETQLTSYLCRWWQVLGSNLWGSITESGLARLPGWDHR